VLWRARACVWGGGRRRARAAAGTEPRAALLTLWALQLLPADFEPRGSTWPFWLPLDAEAAPSDFSAAAVVRRARALARRMGLLGGGGAGDDGLRGLGRAELERAMLWQSADELRHYEYDSGSESHRYDGSSGGSGHAAQGGASPMTSTTQGGGGGWGGSSGDVDCPEGDGSGVVRVEGSLISLIGGYSLNYYHFLTEMLPGMLRLRPMVLEAAGERGDPVYVLAHNISWTRELLLDVRTTSTTPPPLSQVGRAAARQRRGRAG
jgi:hypothetical protein